MGRATRVRYRCQDCRRMVTGGTNEHLKHGCEFCGGPIVPVRYGPGRKRKR